MYPLPDNWMYIEPYESARGRALLRCLKCGNKKYFSVSNIRHGRPLVCGVCCALKQKPYNLRRRRLRRKLKIHDLYMYYSGICWICGGQCDLNDKHVDDNGVTICGENYPSRDHVIPISKGGTDDFENIRLAHRRCNRERGND